MKIEFLIIKNEDSNCNSIKTFKSFLSINSELNVYEKTISYNKFGVNFNLKTDLIKNLDKKERYFFFTIERTYLSKMIQQKCEHYKKFKEDLDNFIKIKRFIKNILEESKYGFNVTILWDDTSYYYSRISYPLINEIENLMRKLIYKFMYVNIGKNWLSKAIPKDLENDIKKNIARDKKEKYIIQECLSVADFIDLKKLLFDNYCNPNKEEIFAKIDKARRVNELELKVLKEIVPKSNWDRYFSKFVKIDKLDEKWEKLYELRNKIAHNKIIGRGDYEEIVKLTEEIKKSLLIAIDKLDEISIDEEEKKEISLTNFITNINNIASALSNPVLHNFKLNDTFLENIMNYKLMGEGVAKVLRDWSFHDQVNDEIINEDKQENKIDKGPENTKCDNKNN